MRRRSFLHAAGSSLLLAACGKAGVEEPRIPPEDPEPRLTARPNAAATLTLPTGLLRTTVGVTRLVTYVPPSVVGLASVPLFVFLHGSNGNPDPFLTAFQPYCDEHGVVMLAPYARGSNWEGIFVPFGEDVNRISTAMQYVFNRAPVDPARITFTGFSDGATIALAIGRANGDLVPRINAYAPGAVIPVVRAGMPTIAITHGTLDDRLPFAVTRDEIVPQLRGFGHTVDFHEFEGGHGVPLEVVDLEMDRIGSVTTP